MSISAQTLRLSEPVVSDASSETFGASLDTSTPRATLNELLSSPSKYTENPFLLTTKIAKVCQKKGCFFIAQENNHTVRVSFLDYGFFLPTDSSGKTVTLTGTLVERNMSKEQAAHFKADLASETELIKAGKVYEIVANSVKVPLS